MLNPTRSEGRVIAVGDIHGCSIALRTLLERVDPGRDDLLIPLGDVIDYGPDSRGVLGLLKSARERCRLVLLTGNHEEMLFDALDRPRELGRWTACGGDRTLASYGVEDPRDLPADDLALLRSARPFFETDRHAFVHAGYYPNHPFADTPASALFWESLDPARAWPHFSGKTVVVGHTPQTSGRVLDLGFLVCVDTDCSRGGWLTALDAASGTFWQADQRGEFREGRLPPRKERYD